MAKFRSYLGDASRGLEGYVDCITKCMLNYH